MHLTVIEEETECVQGNVTGRAGRKKWEMLRFYTNNNNDSWLEMRLRMSS